MYNDITITPGTYIADIETAWELALLEDANRALRAEALRLAERVLALSNEQITDPMDHRLERFWEIVHEHANDSDYCQIYDEAMSALGAPPRRQDYTITVVYTFGLSLTRDEADNYDHWDYDPRDYDNDPDISISRD